MHFHENSAFPLIWPTNSEKKLHFHTLNTGFRRLRKCENHVFYSVPSTFFCYNPSQMLENLVFPLWKCCCGSSSGVSGRAPEGSKSYFSCSFETFWSLLGPFSGSKMHQNRPGASRGLLASIWALARVLGLLEGQNPSQSCVPLRKVSALPYKSHFWP